jgi:hypothetical protein
MERCEKERLVSYSQLAISVEDTFFERFKEVIHLTDQHIESYLDRIVDVFVLPALSEYKIPVHFMICSDIEYAFSFIGDATIGVNMNLFLSYGVEKIAALLVSAYISLIEGEVSSPDEIEDFFQKVNECLRKLGFDLEQMPDIRVLVENGFYGSQAVELGQPDRLATRKLLS